MYITQLNITYWDLCTMLGVSPRKMVMNDEIQQTQTNMKQNHIE